MPSTLHISKYQGGVQGKSMAFKSGIVFVHERAWFLRSGIVFIQRKGMVFVQRKGMAY